MEQFTQTSWLAGRTPRSLIVPSKTVPSKAVPSKTAPNKTAPNKTAPNKTKHLKSFSLAPLTQELSLC